MPVASRARHFSMSFTGRHVNFDCLKARAVDLLSITKPAKCPSINNSPFFGSHLGVLQQVAEGVEVVLLEVVAELQVNGRHLLHICKCVYLTPFTSTSWCCLNRNVVTSCQHAGLGTGVAEHVSQGYEQRALATRSVECTMRKILPW